MPYKVDLSLRCILDDWPVESHKLETVEHTCRIPVFSQAGWLVGWLVGW